MNDSFERFLHSRVRDLRRIASRTRGELSSEDMMSEAWLIAIEIGQKRGWAFNFGDEEDQDTLLAWLHNRFVKYADKSIRHAIKLDRDWDDEDSERAGNTLARLLTAPLESDPQMRQQLHEERQDRIAVVQHSYSQASAYVLLLVRVDWHLEDLAALLCIGVSALRQRLKGVGLWVRVQPSLFDGIEILDPDFMPWRRSRRNRMSLGASPASWQHPIWPVLKANFDEKFP